MRPEDILDAIGDVDESYVKKAKEKKKSRKRIWITAGSVAAGIMILYGLSIAISHISAEKHADSYINDEGLVASDYVWIYYVADTGEGQFGSHENINRQKEYLQLSPEEIFEVWKSKNKIGADVKLIDVRIDSDGRTSQSEVEGVVKHEIGDSYVYNITISKSVENYYDTIDGETLLESLRLTMTGYSGIEFERYNLILQ